MKTNTKGFTLIELLAVIVILAVIALIASPIVLGIINNSRKSAQARSVEAYASAAQQAFATAMSTPGYMGEDIFIYNDTAAKKTYACSTENCQIPAGKTEIIKEEVKYSGSTVECQEIYYDQSTGYIGLDHCKVQGSETEFKYCNAAKGEQCKLDKDGAKKVDSTAGGAAENKTSNSNSTSN